MSFRKIIKENKRYRGRATTTFKLSMMIKAFFLSGILLLRDAGLPRAAAAAEPPMNWKKKERPIQKEIEDVKRSLDETHRNRKETLGQLALLATQTASS